MFRAFNKSQNRHLNAFIHNVGRRNYKFKGASQMSYGQKGAVLRTSQEEAKNFYNIYYKYKLT